VCLRQHRATRLITTACGSTPTSTLHRHQLCTGYQDYTEPYDYANIYVEFYIAKVYTNMVSIDNFVNTAAALRQKPPPPQNHCRRRAMTKTRRRRRIVAAAAQNLKPYDQKRAIFFAPSANTATPHMTTTTSTTPRPRLHHDRLPRHRPQQNVYSNSRTPVNSVRVVTLRPRHSRCDYGREEEVPEGDAGDEKEEKRMEARDFKSSRKRPLHSRYD
jgi:hypothetical protein